MGTVWFGTCVNRGGAGDIAFHGQCARFRSAGQQLLAPAKTNQPAPLAVGVVRHDAEQALQDFLRLRAQPDLAGLKYGHAEDWQQAMATAAEGDDYFGHGKFELALSAYQDAS